MDATADLACAFKPQIAYFAAAHAEDQLQDLIAYIHARHPAVPVVLDAKRGDIGATAQQYAREAFERYGADALTVNSLAILALTFGCIVYGRLIDALGSGPTFMLGSLLLAGASYAFYHGLATDTSQLVPLYALAGFSVGIVGAVPYVMVNAFPAVVRFSGLSFSYNVAYAIFGGLTPMLVTLWMKEDVLAPSHYVVSLAALGFVLGLLLWLQQRSQRQSAPQAA